MYSRARDPKEGEGSARSHELHRGIYFARDETEPPSWPSRVGGEIFPVQSVVPATSEGQKGRART
jgi:hypothetical protein